MSSIHLVVIGRRPRRLCVAAFLAADLGMEVAIVEKELNPGGCLPVPRLYSLQSTAARGQDHQ